MAIRSGDEAVVQLLLGQKENAPRADLSEGAALILAAENGHGDVSAGCYWNSLCTCARCAPRADVRDGRALQSAASKGHLGVVRMLLKWWEHAPKAHCREGTVLFDAVRNGHIDVVKLLNTVEHYPHIPPLRYQHVLQAMQMTARSVMRMELKGALSNRKLK